MRSAHPKGWALRFSFKATDKEPVSAKHPGFGMFGRGSGYGGAVEVTMERKPGFFDYGGAMMRFLQRVVELIFLNAMFLVGCIPVLTIGTSLLALHEVSMSHTRYGSNVVWKEFFQAYRRHLRSGILLTPILLVVGAALVLDFMWLGNMDGSMMAGALLAFVVLLTVLLGMIVSYFLPVMGEGKLTLWQAAQKAFYLCLLNWPRALLLSVVRIAYVFISLRLPMFFMTTLPVFAFIGCSLCALLFSMLLENTIPTEDE